MENAWVISVIILVIIVIVWLVWKNKEYFTLTEPSFRASLLADMHAVVKDKRGMTDNDYLLESKLLTGTTINPQRKIM
jgi:hypothetical protein